MNQEVAHSNKRKIRVFRGTTELISNVDSYNLLNGEELTVLLSDHANTKSQNVFEIVSTSKRGAKFDHGNFSFGIMLFLFTYQ